MRGRFLRLGIASLAVLVSLELLGPRAKTLLHRGTSQPRYIYYAVEPARLNLPTVPAPIQRQVGAAPQVTDRACATLLR